MGVESVFQTRLDYKNSRVCICGPDKFASSYQKRQASIGNVGIRRFVFTNFQADNYGVAYTTARVD